jgi:hypothetical protein
MTAALITPFSVSSIYIIYKQNLREAIRVTEVGFVAIIIYLFALFIGLEISPELRPEDSNKSTDIISNNTELNNTKQPSIFNTSHITKSNNSIDNITISKTGNVTRIIIKEKNPTIIQLLR